MSGALSEASPLHDVRQSSGVDQAATLALRETISAFKARRSSVASRPSYAERLTALNALSDAILARDPELLRVLPMTGLAFAAGFLRSTNLEHLVAREIANTDALERFVRIEDRKSVRVLPRGLAAHWIAGNVPLLGLFSWALSALVGNVNVVRLSSRSDDFMTPVLGVLGRLSTAGQALADDTLVVQFPSDDQESHRAMSAAADVRIAWGGREAVEAVAALPAAWDCETIVLGPRMSLAVVDPELLTDRVLARLVSDIAYFDQQACSSPQWVFVKTPAGGDAVEATVRRFSETLSAQTRTLPRHTLDAGETYRIALDRARVVLDGGALRRDRQTAWTLAVVDAPDLRVTCANRFVQIVPFADISEIPRFIPSNVQTVVMLLGAEESDRFSETAARLGVHRFARPGEGNHFENPWDGVPLLSRLTRWTMRSEAAQGADATR